MNKFKLLFVAFTLSLFAIGQGFVQSSFTPPTCFGMCDGNVVFTSTATTGPFTATLTNNASCPNSTIQSSSGNSISITGLCTCSGTYTVSIYNSSNIIVGFELLQVPITATSALTVLTPTTNPAVCSSCCNGSVYVGWSGGFAPNPNDATVTIDGASVGASYYPYPNVCVGQHTICVTDLDNCQVCTTFSMNYVGITGLTENSALGQITISPNPSFDRIQIKTNSNIPIHTFKCFDLNAKLVLEFEDGSELKTIDISTLQRGIYFIELRDKNNLLIGRQKLVKIGQ